MRPREDRSKILALLSTERYVPTSEIATYLGTSLETTRTILSRLRARGIGIECIQGLGYRRDPSKDGATSMYRFAARRPRPPSDTLGGYLVSLRERARLSQGALAGRIGVAPSYVSYIELGKRPLLKDIAGAMADVMGLTAIERDRLFVLAGHCPPGIARLSTKRLEAVLALVNEEEAA